MEDTLLLWVGQAVIDFFGTFGNTLAFGGVAGVDGWVEWIGKLGRKTIGDHDSRDCDTPHGVDLL